MTGAGIGPGDKVVFWSENRPEWIAAFWGCLLNGSIAVPVDYRASADLLDRIVRIVDARAVLAGNEVASSPGQWRFSDFDWSAAPIPQREARAGELCEIIFTSGATADPKGVTITHSNILANIVPIENEIRKYRKWSVPFAPIRFLNLLPLSHLFGQTMATFIPPVLPGEVVFMTGFNPREIVRQLHSRRISVLVSVPKILDVLRAHILQTVPEAAEPPPIGASWMRRWWRYRRVHNLLGWKFWCFVVGAAPLDAGLEEFWSKLGFLVVQGYGLTETAPIATLNHPFHTSKGSVGKPIGGVEVKIASDGEILVRGPNVTPGYFNAIGEESVFEDGWFHTGDIGSIDEEGKVFVRGRKKETIVTPDGLNVFPEDVERVLNEIPGVEDSAVVGVTREGRERVHAVLVLHPDTPPGTVIQRANGKLESHQQIQSFSAWPHQRLPRTEGTQKLKRVALREWVAGAAAPGMTAERDDLLAGISDETPIAQLGLSSLDRVELTMRAERSGSGVMDESTFAQARTVGDLRQMTRQPTAHAEESVNFPRWSRSFLARTMRRIALPVLPLPLLRIFVWLRVRGRENILNLAGPVLFAANHQSVFDVPTILAAMPASFRYRTATAMGMDWFRPHFHPSGFGLPERFGNSLQYYLACLVFNGFPLPRHEAGARDALRYVGELVSDNWSVLIFPEGVRTKAGEIASFRPGVGMMSSRLNLSVIPVRIEGLERVLPESWHWPRPGRVTVTFGGALELHGEDYRGLAKEVEAAVRGLG